jgi:hypothetical protein
VKPRLDACERQALTQGVTVVCLDDVKVVDMAAVFELDRSLDLTPLEGGVILRRCSPPLVVPSVEVLQLDR